MRVTYTLAVNTPEELVRALQEWVTEQLAGQRAQYEGHSTRGGKAVIEGQIRALMSIERLLNNLVIER